MEANFIDDTTIDGKAKFYLPGGNLYSIISFSNGTKNGPANIYYSNSQLKDSCFYVNGKKHGNHFVYDSSGFILYQDYYFHGQQVGEQIFYKNGQVSQFGFINFEKKKIYSCGYDTIGMVGYSGELLNMNVYPLLVDDSSEFGWFAYLIYPPKVNVQYFLGIADYQNKNQKILDSLSPNLPFIDTVLKKPPIGMRYFISANYNDKFNNYHKTFITSFDLADLK